MLQITRQQFIDAIKSGIDAAPELTKNERRRLLLVADTATHADGNFSGTKGKLNVGCPADQAKLPESICTKFAYAYDDFIVHISPLHSRDWWDGVDVVS